MELAKLSNQQLMFALSSLIIECTLAILAVGKLEEDSL